ncbi:hypothetical protein CAC42_2267 [Sphaceloma murrayae]|uniref:Uncharacterized protein n=1 Tax=Sphaceloma murrayae TaxID=2082308 RepID=A0A2K1QIP3_9PEZI|nr:hypothetical protein CAC42_2267 [Sphaceloma murrayae]
MSTLRVPTNTIVPAIASSLRSAISSAIEAEAGPALPRTNSTRAPFTNTSTSYHNQNTLPATTVPPWTSPFPSSTPLSSPSVPSTEPPSTTPPPPAPTLLAPPPPSSPLTPATIGGITAASAFCLGSVLLLALLLYRRRPRPSYLEAGSHSRLPISGPLSPCSPLLDRPATDTADPISTAMAEHQDAGTYMNPYYAALTARNPGLFGPQKEEVVKGKKWARHRRKSAFLIRGWERTRLSGIAEELEVEEEERGFGIGLRESLRRSTGGANEFGWFRFWEDEDEDEDGSRDEG